MNDYLNLSGHDGEIDESIILDWADKAIERVSTDEQYCQRIVLLKVHNYKVQLPSDFRYVCQAAYCLEPKDECRLREQITQYTQKALGSDCELEINLKCCLLYTSPSPRDS